MDALTLTFGEVAENHVGMQKVGKLAPKGFTIEDLDDIAARFPGRTEMVYLECVETTDDDAAVLILKDGVDSLCGVGTADAILEEQRHLDHDKKAWMHGRVVNKRARWNLCFDTTAQEPDYENKRGRVVALADVPHTHRLHRAVIELHPKAHTMRVEGNYYYDVTKCGIGYHGDAERRLVIGTRFGAEFPLVYRWYRDSTPIGAKIPLPILHHGDMYVMSAKAAGTDWRQKRYRRYGTRPGGHMYKRHPHLCINLPTSTLGHVRGVQTTSESQPQQGRVTLDMAAVGRTCGEKNHRGPQAVRVIVITWGGAT